MKKHMYKRIVEPPYLEIDIKCEFLYVKFYCKLQPINKAIIDKMRKITGRQTNILSLNFDDTKIRLLEDYYLPKIMKILTSVQHLGVDIHKKNIYTSEFYILHSWQLA